MIVKKAFSEYPRSKKGRLEKQERNGWPMLKMVWRKWVLGASENGCSGLVKIGVGASENGCWGLVKMGVGASENGCWG